MSSGAAFDLDTILEELLANADNAGPQTAQVETAKVHQVTFHAATLNGLHMLVLRHCPDMEFIVMEFGTSVLPPHAQPLCESDQLVLFQYVKTLGFYKVSCLNIMCIHSLPKHDINYQATHKAVL